LLNDYKGSWFASYFQIYNLVNNDTNSFCLPKLTLNFHKKNTPQTYAPHHEKLVYGSICEDNYPIIIQLRKEIDKLYNTKFTFVSFLLYPTNQSYIKAHCDENQIEGLSSTDFIEGTEVIVSLCIVGNKMAYFKDIRTKEEFFFLHEPGSIYTMQGCQRMGIHSKIAGNLSKISSFTSVWY
jgi:hypothetical protein